MAALGASSLTSIIASSLPKHAEPQLKNATDALAIAVHAGLLAVGFKLTGLGESHNVETPFTAEAPQPLPQEWNASSSVDLKYTHSQSSMQFLIHVSRLGGRVSIQAMGIGHDIIKSFDVTAKDFVSDSALPTSPTKDAASPDDAQHAITGIYITPSRLTDFGNHLKLSIIQPLVPGLQKEGYEDTSRTTTSTSTSNPRNELHPRDPVHDHPRYDPLRADSPPAQPHPLADPSMPRPARPVPAGDFPPPGFEDPYDIHRPARGWPPSDGVPSAPGYGERDLFPPGMGPNDPLGRSIGPRGGGGMIADDFDVERIRGGARSDPFHPQVPPGARYDPVGPGAGGGVPYDPLSGDMGPGGLRRGGLGRGGGPPNPFSGFSNDDFI